MNKIEILKKIFDEQSKTLENLNSSVFKFKLASNINENDTLDPEDYSHQDEAREMKLRMEQLLLKETKSLEVIEKCFDSTNENVQFGSLLDLGTKYVFIGASIHPFQYQGKDVFSISTEAPIYQKLIGKKIGDQINIGKESYTIVAIQ